MCVRISDNSSNKSFCEWISYPDGSDDYTEDNQYMRLCSSVGVNHTNPKDLLYEDVPIHTDDDFVIDLPDKATKTSVFRNNLERNIENLKEYKFSNSKLLKISPSVALTTLLSYTLLTDWPIAVPLSGEEAQAMGYPNGMGFVIFCIFALVFPALVALNIHFILKYTIPELAKVYDTAITKINELADREYKYIKKN